MFQILVVVLLVAVGIFLYNRAQRLAKEERDEALKLKDRASAMPQAPQAETENETQEEHQSVDLDFAESKEQAEPKPQPLAEQAVAESPELEPQTENIAPEVEVGRAEVETVLPEPEPEPVKAAAPDISWGNITLKRAMEQYQASEGAIEAHDALLAVISECYKQRKNSKYLQLGQEYDTAYSALFAASREKVLSKSPKAEFKGTGFMQLSTLCSDAGRFDAAIALCNKAIEYGLEDGTVTGFEGRIKRIEKARDKASA
ncbi:procyclic acidic repetitive family protein [Shewanella algae]|uniref:procyclic acidic repetitive family protein n=1 Tax=Shewanella algae TaxID=38313 RepID=UPI001F2BA1CF|nr:procyclic acidic repetitive family protein [Shewanella algae]MCE9781462.1 procyclic acidic repetitive family protein [Shewanella algae]MCE9827967.1 procyclic acidic repetitive family protein [Shewanella algae]